MPNHANYDPVKAHQYYMDHRKLKGRKPGNQSDVHPIHAKSGDGKAAARARVGRLTSKLSKLQGALTKAEAALSAKRRSEVETKRKNSDGKSTAAEKQASKEYRDKNKAKIQAKEKKDNKSSSSSSGSSSSGGLSSMSSDELVSRINKIQGAIKSAKQQLSAARQQLGQLAHSEFLSAVGSNRYDFHNPTSRRDSVKMAEDDVADFSGWASRNNLRCTDGRTIVENAFKDNDGHIVPLVWSHGHADVNNVLGHCKLENRPEGVYARAYFNSTPQGQNAKKQVQHGDLKWLSIFANNLVEKTTGMMHAGKELKDVLKGNIREVSLVLAGANPGAVIDNVTIAHGDGEFDYFEDQAIITTGLDIEIKHAADDTNSEDGPTVQEVVDSMTEPQKEVLFYMVSQAMEHADDEGESLSTDAGPVEEDDITVETSETDSEESDDSEGSDEDESTDNSGEEDSDTDNDDEAGAEVQHNDNSQEDSSMTHNIFENAGKGVGRPTATLSHDDVKSIVASAEDIGSLKKAFIAHVRANGLSVDGELKHGIENIEYLFPDAKTLESSPAFISRRMEWVDKVLGSVRKSPISRIKTITADITPDEARARGYIKGNMKNEEFFALSKRETTPQTVYKKQKLDRDDVIDIVDLDVVAWLKAEMKVMLDEEIAGAILIGDGRSIGDEDKIKETNIRPIVSDAELYVTTANVNLDDSNSSIEELVDSVISHRQYYKGSGQPTFYTTETIISKFLTVKDNFGRRIYSSIADVASVLRVADIVPVEVMERVPDVVGIMVNLSDYTLGADKGGQATMFDDFDIDYNKLRYLIETRLSGALTQPKAAVVFRKVAGSAVVVTPTEPTFADNVVTVPTVTGVTYKNADTNATLTTGAPVTLTEGQELNVKALPASAGYYFEDSTNDEWTYTGTAS